MVSNYSMSFTNGTLLRGESQLVAGLYAENEDWQETRRQILDDNLLQMRRPRSARDIFAEVKSRLSALTEEEFRLLLNGPQTDQLAVLWLAACKRYPFIAEFARDVVREKFLRFDLDLTKAEYEAFFNAKAVWSERLERTTRATRDRQRQIVFKMMREAGLIDENHRIVPAFLSPELVRVIASDDPDLLAIFPVSEDVVRS